MSHNQPTGAAALDVDTLPPLPATAASLLPLVIDPDVDVNQLAAVIERDPPLSARLIGIANSAYYSPRQSVTTVKSAIVSVLGLNVVRNVTFGIALAGGLKVDARADFDINAYWIMALGTADLSSALARAARPPVTPSADELYLSGLLHNLGQLLLAYRCPNETATVAQRLRAEPAMAREDLEREIIGIDTWAAGARLARCWHLPEFVATDIASFAEHGEPSTPRARVLRAAHDWIAGVLAGRPAMLRVDGLEETSCEGRANVFLDRFDGLVAMARSLG
jgi:HD-like signal output (HDOD) protein